MNMPPIAVQIANLRIAAVNAKIMAERTEDAALVRKLYQEAEMWERRADQLEAGIKK